MRERLAEETDVPAIMALYDEVFAEQEAGRINVGWKRGVYPCEQTILEGIDKCELHVFTNNGIVVAAFSITTRHSPEWSRFDWKLPAARGEYITLHTPIVARSMGGRGIGGLILSYFDMFALDYGYKVLRTDTNADNIPMRRLLAKYGFKEVGQIECTYNGIDGVKLIGLEKER